MPDDEARRAIVAEAAKKITSALAEVLSAVDLEMADTTRGSVSISEEDLRVVCGLFFQPVLSRMGRFIASVAQVGWALARTGRFCALNDFTLAINTAFHAYLVSEIYKESSEDAGETFGKTYEDFLSITEAEILYLIDSLDDIMQELEPGKIKYTPKRLDEILNDSESAAGNC